MIETIDAQSQYEAMQKNYIVLPLERVFLMCKNQLRHFYPIAFDIEAITEEFLTNVMYRRMISDQAIQATLEAISDQHRYLVNHKPSEQANDALIRFLLAIYDEMKAHNLIFHPSVTGRYRVVQWLDSYTPMFELVYEFLDHSDFELPILVYLEDGI